MASPLNARRDQRAQDCGGGIPIFPRGIHQIAASDRNNLPAIANPSRLPVAQMPVIRSAIRFVEPALKPLCEIADGRILLAGAASVPPFFKMLFSHVPTSLLSA